MDYASNSVQAAAEKDKYERQRRRELSQSLTESLRLQKLQTRLTDAEYQSSEIDSYRVKSEMGEHVSHDVLIGLFHFTLFKWVQLIPVNYQTRNLNEKYEKERRHEMSEMVTESIKQSKLMQREIEAESIKHELASSKAKSEIADNVSEC